MIDRYRTRGVVVVVIVASLAGCATLPESGSHEVDFDGPVERTDGEFHMEGTVEIDSTINFNNIDTKDQ
jgi:hypothetical protein